MQIYVIFLPLKHLKYNLMKENTEMFLLGINNSLSQLPLQISLVKEHVFTAANEQES